IKAIEHGHAIPDLGKSQQAGFVAVVEIGGVIWNLVSEIDQLSLQRSTLVKTILRQLRKLAGRIVAGMFDDAFAHFKSQVEAAKAGVTKLEVFHDPQGVQVVVEEKAALAHGGV